MDMEIGSIFEIDPNGLARTDLPKGLPKIPVQWGNSYTAHYFNTGRAAIEALLVRLKGKGYERLYLPSFLCDSVSDAAKRAGLTLQYYGVNSDLTVDIGALRAEKNTILYVAQYFGQRIEVPFLEFIRQARTAGMMVVEDISLSLLSRDEACVGFGDYTIGSLRKWFPIVDGGILLSREDEAEFDLADAANDYTLYYFTAQLLKHKYLSDGGNDKHLKEIFLSYNRMGMTALFSDYTVRKMSGISADLLKGLDLDQIRERRICNYDMLSSMLASVPQVKLLVDRSGAMTPLGMVILVEDRDRLLEHLIAKGIYCNVHWRENEAMAQFPETQYLAARCITIPCDQRYGEREMRYIYETVSKYYGGE